MPLAKSAAGRGMILGAGLAGAIGFFTSPAYGQADTPVAITAARMLEVVQGTLVPDAVILVEADRITAAGPRSRVTIPADARRIDLGDATLLPGLIDAHVHLTIAGPPRTNALVTLRAGFTTVQDLGAIGDGNIRLRDSIRAGRWIGPRIVSSGQWLGKSGMMCDFNGIGVHDSAEMLQHVRDDIARGADAIKVCMTGWVSEGLSAPDLQEFSDDELAGVVRLSRAAGKPVLSHAIGLGGARASVRAGVTGLAHAAFLDSATVRLMLSQGTYLVSTLFSLQGQGDRLAYGVLWQRMQAARAAGIWIIFGTDAGVIPHGTNAREFAALVRLGMSPLEAIRAATSSASRALGLADQIGTLEPGMAADIIAVPGNPLNDIMALERVGFVMQGGRVIRNDLGPTGPD